MDVGRRKRECFQSFPGMKSTAAETVECEE